MLWEEFRGRYAAQLNEQQIGAVRATKGPVLLLAVPGSGKTTVLVTRLGYMLLVEGIDPGSVLTLTYTVAATEDMRARFASIFGGELAGKLQFRTINGVCAQILYRFSLLTGREQFSLADNEKEGAGLLGRITADITGIWPSEAELREIRTRISYIKNSCLTPEEIGDLDGESGLPVSRIYPAYQRAMREMRRMDYDDQLTAAYAVLRKFPELLKEYRAKYRYFLVDEAQDTSRIQHEIIALLSGETENLFMVGDEDQSIYGFRAAYPQALLEFDRRHPGARILLMEENFRSTPQIVSAADRLIAGNRQRHEKHMRTGNGDGPEIRFIDLKGRGAQYSYLLKVAQDVARETAPRVTAVLYRDNDSMIPLADLLEREGVEFHVRNADYLFFSARTVLDIRDILFFAENPTDTEVFLRIYYKLGTYLSRELAAAAAESAAAAPGGRIPVIDAALRLPGLPGQTAKNLRSLKGNLRALPSDTAEEAIGRIMRRMGYAEYLKNAGISDGRVAVLRMLAKRESSLRELFGRLDYLQQFLKGGNTGGECPFILSTVHASKGLEYDKVYLMDVIDGILPQEAPLEEERRLFYVAVTRAKRALNVFCLPGKSSFVRELKRADAGERGPKARVSAVGASRRAEFDPAGYEEFVSGLAEGMAVTHADFGEGVITSLTDSRARIRFAQAEKTFLLRILYEKGLISVG